MEELKDKLTAEQLQELEEAIKKIADSLLDKFNQKKELISKEIKDIKEERDRLDTFYKNTSDWKERDTAFKKRSELYATLKIKEKQLVNVNNEIKAVINGGTILEITDTLGKVYPDVPDFRKVKTDVISFNEETILTEPSPAFIPFIDEERFERSGGIFDAIRIAPDSYLLSYSKYSFHDDTPLILVTLDQLVLISLYYFAKLKATLRASARAKTERSKESYFALPEERRLRYYAQRGFYSTLNATLKKKYTEQEWENLPLSEKEKLVPAYKSYGIKKIISKLDSNEMYSSFHNMYNVFINPKALSFKNKENTITKNIGESGSGYANPEVWDYWVQFRDMMRYKIKDIEYQKAEQSDTYKTAVETSFGESNTDDYLLADFGVKIKRQNGDKINAEETEQIKQGLVLVNNTFGSLKKHFLENNIKISHAGNRLIFAMKAVGVYIKDMGTIGVSAKYGNIQFQSTLAHEIAHFIDNKLGEQNGKRWITDDFESQAGIIAFTFRNNMNKPKNLQSDYINATKECFARALQQYFVMQNYGDDAEIVYGYGAYSTSEKIANQEVFVNKENFNSKIKPLIEQFLQENKDFFSAELQMKKVVEEIKENTAEIVSAIENKEVEPNGFDVSKINLKGVTTIFTEDNGKTLIYGTKTNQTRISVLKMSQEEIKEDIDFEKKIYEKTIKDISEFNESEIKNSYAFSTKEKLDIIKLHNQSILKNEERKKIIIPFLESHLEPNKEVEPNELQEAIETLKMLLETLPDDEKKEVEEALEVLEMLDGNSFAKGGLIAPNGNESNLTAEQYKLVRTPEFKAWFGDWENDPDSASKIVDKNGEPLVVYHGTMYDFNSFNDRYKAHYFAVDKKYSSFVVTEYRGGLKEYERIIPCFLNVRKLQKVKFPIEKNNVALYLNDHKFLKEIDGGIFGFDDIDDEKIDKIKGIDTRVYVVFNPNQIKLADGTNKTFDPNSNDIRFESGGFIEHKQKQLKIINKTNPAPNSYNTWIRTVDDVLTAEEAFEVAFEDGAMYPDFDTNDMQEAIKSGFVTIYSSNPIKEGVFVTPSKMNAEEYAGGRGKKVYSKNVSINDIAWIDESEGQYAPID